MNGLQRMLLGSGRLPDEQRAALVAEGIVVLEEGLVGSVTYRHYRAPNRRANWRKEAAAGSIAITGRRLLVWAGRMRHIDVPLDHPIRSTIEVTLDGADRACFAYDAGATDPARSGRVEVRLRTAAAARVVQLLNHRT
jgi:hypothetical protein